MKINKVLILGSIPPPIGGVTIHVNRLCAWLDSFHFDYKFYDIRRSNIMSIFFNIAKYKVCHINISNINAIFIIVIWCRINKTTSIVTFHGNLFRYYGMQKIILRIILLYSDIPILLNQASFENALNINRNSLFISSFIPPLKKESLDSNIIDKIKSYSYLKPIVIITNAYDLVYDKDGKEIYGIFDLIEYIYCVNCLLIISDPSGNYKTAAFKKYDRDKIKNILFISIPHSFFAALEYADIYIRNTVTDGDSISIHEALSIGKTVFATSVVTRPKGTNVYKNLHEIDLSLNNVSVYQQPSVVDKLIRLYNDIQNKSFKI